MANYQVTNYYDSTLYDYFSGNSVCVTYHYRPENVISYQIGNDRKKVPKAVVKLLKLIFDKDRMRKYMLKHKFNPDQILQISENSMLDAYSALLYMSNLESGSSYHNCTAYSQFCSAIPFISHPTIMNSNDLNEYINFFNDLKLMRDAYKIMSGCPIDQNTLYRYYKKLNTKIRPLDKSSSEFHHIYKYVKHSHSPIHDKYTLEVKDVFKISRKGENSKFEEYDDLRNRKLLWHGSGMTNFAAILSDGLKIAPKHVPITGAMFGKGLYFADVVSKSANYCKATPDNPYGILLLAEVALGDSFIWRHFKHEGKVKKLPHGYDSVKAIGKLEPDRRKTIRTHHNVKIPLGYLVKNTKYSSSDLLLRHNEYIVYDINQALCQYLVVLKFIYNY